MSFGIRAILKITGCNFLTYFSKVFLQKSRMETPRSIFFLRCISLFILVVYRVQIAEKIAHLIVSLVLGQDVGCCEINPANFKTLYYLPCYRGVIIWFPLFIAFTTLHKGYTVFVMQQSSHTCSRHFAGPLDEGYLPPLKEESLHSKKKEMYIYGKIELFSQTFLAIVQLFSSYHYCRYLDIFFAIMIPLGYMCLKRISNIKYFSLGFLRAGLQSRILVECNRLDFLKFSERCSLYLDIERHIEVLEFAIETMALLYRSITSIHLTTMPTAEHVGPPKTINVYGEYLKALMLCMVVGTVQTVGHSFTHILPLVEPMLLGSPRVYDHFCNAVFHIYSQKIIMNTNKNQPCAHQHLEDGEHEK